MAWTNPTLRTSGDLVSAAIWNTDAVDNLVFLGNSHDHSGDAGDGATSSGTLPSGIILAFDATCPSGWTRVSAFDGLYLRGASTYGGTGGGSSHSHDGWNFTTRSIDINDITSAGYALSGSGDYIYDGISAGSTTFYPVEADFAAATFTPLYVDVIFCKKN